MEKNIYYLVQCSYDARGDLDDDDHEFQMMMTNEQFSVAHKAVDNGIDGAYADVHWVCDVTKEEYEKFDEQLGGRNGSEILEKIEALLEKKKSKKNIPGYCLVEVVYRGNPESYDEDHCYQMMMTTQELSMWSMARYDYYDDGDGDGDEHENDEGVVVSAPNVYSICEVTKAEYYKFLPLLSGLNAGYIRSLIKNGLIKERMEEDNEEGDEKDDEEDEDEGEDSEEEEDDDVKKAKEPSKKVKL